MNELENKSPEYQSFKEKISRLGLQKDLMDNFGRVTDLLGKIENYAIITQTERNFLLKIFKQENHGVIERFLDFKQQDIDMVIDSLQKYPLVVHVPSIDSYMCDFGDGDFLLRNYSAWDADVRDRRCGMLHVDENRGIYEILPEKYSRISGFDAKGCGEIREEKENGIYIYESQKKHDENGKIMVDLSLKLQYRKVDVAYDEDGIAVVEGMDGRKGYINIDSRHTNNFRTEELIPPVFLNKGGMRLDFDDSLSFTNRNKSQVIGKHPKYGEVIIRKRYEGTAFVGFEFFMKKRGKKKELSLEELVEKEK